MFKGNTSFPERMAIIASILLLSAPAIAHDALTNTFITVAPLGITVAPFGTEQCVAGNVSICGLTIGAPALALGANATLAVPSPYMHQPFTVQCTTAGYLIIDASSVTCTPMACPVSNVSLCGAPVPVPAGALIGNVINVPVPVAALADPSTASSDLSFTARCVDDGNGGVTYQVANASGISCDLFPCQDSKIRLCETSIPIMAGAPLGGVLHLSMPPPFVPDPFTVQCVGSGGNPPVYQLTDVSAVTCGVMPQKQ